MASIGFFFSAATFAIARLVPEFVPAMMRSRPWVSIHSRSLLAATSALFWWSATSSSTFLPLIAPPRSAMAIRMASAPFGPSMSEYSPDMSVMKPMRMTSPEIWAEAPPDTTTPAVARAAAMYFSFIPISSFEMTAAGPFLPIDASPG